MKKQRNAAPAKAAEPENLDVLNCVDKGCIFHVVEHHCGAAPSAPDPSAVAVDPEIQELIDEALAQEFRAEIGLSESGSAPALAWLKEKFGVKKEGMIGDAVRIISTTIDGKHVGARLVDNAGKSWRLSEALYAYAAESALRSHRQGGPLEFDKGPTG